MVQKIAFLLAYIVLLAAGVIWLEKSIQARIDRAMKVNIIYVVEPPATEGRA